MTADDHHFRREDRAVRWQRIASHIAEHPEDLAIALANCDRWLSLVRDHPAPLLEWQRLIHVAQSSPEALQDFVLFLAAPNHDAQPLKSCSPFVGMPIGERPSPAHDFTRNSFLCCGITSIPDLGREIGFGAVEVRGLGRKEGRSPNRPCQWEPMTKCLRSTSSTHHWPRRIGVLRSLVLTTFNYS